MGAIKTKGFMRYSFRRLKVVSHLGLHSNVTPFFMISVKGLHLPARLDMNLWMYASFPCRLLSSLIVYRLGIMSMASTLTGSNCIPSLWTMNPRNCPKVTPKKHLSGFIFNLYFLKC